MKRSKKPLVSVLVHTKNSERTIRKHLESIKNQSYSPVEIIAVDNHSIDNTVSILKDYTRNVFSYGPERSAQRNFAARKAKGDYYVIPDSDMILQKDVIRDCVDLMKQNRNIKEIIIPEKTIGEGFWAQIKAFERDFYIGDDTIEAARFFDAKVFREFNGYDESITGPEDWDLPQRIKKKYQAGRILSYIIHDEGNVSLFRLAKKKYYYALKLARYLSKHSTKTTGTQVIYFLRPAFYRNWQRLLVHPVKTACLFIMLLTEQIAGTIGYLQALVWERK